MTKLLLLISSLTFSISALAVSSNIQSYDCVLAGQYNSWHKNEITQLQIVGDPLANIYTDVYVNGTPMLLKEGVSDPAYQYLFDANNGKYRYGIEIVNYTDSSESYYVYIYDDNTVLGSHRIAGFKCKQSEGL